MKVYNASDLKINNDESVSAAKWIGGFVVAIAIVYGPMLMLWLG